MSTIRPEDLYEIRGDVPDPLGQDPSMRGVSAGISLEKTRVGRPKVIYRGAVNTRVTEPDVYHLEDELFLHLYCPRCGRALRITNKLKRVEFRPDANGGRLTVSAFKCTWDECGLSVKIDDNVMTDV